MANKSKAAELREEVESRKGEVRKQLGPLEAELVELLSLVPDSEPEAESNPEPAAPVAASPAPKSKTNGKPISKRARKGGTRAEQAVAMIAAQPGISASDVAKTMKVKPNYLYRVLGKAEEEGHVRKDGRQYFPATA
jgi:hypothetical protein